MEAEQAELAELAELAAIGSAIRAELDSSSATSEHLRTARAGLIHYVTLPKQRGTVDELRHWMHLRSLRARYIAAACAGAGAAVSLWVWFRLPISFQIARTGTSERADIPGRVGDPIEATGPAPVALRFSEGSSVVLEQGGRARVLSAESAGARVLLETGTAEVSIVHRSQRPTHWNFDVGPFQVLVVGTKFRVSWNPHKQSFDLATWEGAVAITGTCLRGKRTVAAGEHVDLTCPSPHLALAAREPAHGGRADTEPPGPPRLAPEDAHLATGDDSAAARAGKSEGEGGLGATAGGHSVAPKKWRELLRAGKLAEAYRFAEQSDFAKVCRTARASELIALADAARLAGRIDRAVEALLAVRQRFRDSSDAATAAFALGRIAFDKQSAFGDAVQWFTTYLHERPDGPLMGDAVGRLMESRGHQGDRQGAQADARRYLLRFPEGPYAARAREILYE